MILTLGQLAVQRTSRVSVAVTYMRAGISDLSSSARPGKDVVIGVWQCTQAYARPRAFQTDDRPTLSSVILFPPGKRYANSPHLAQSIMLVQKLSLLGSQWIEQVENGVTFHFQIAILILDCHTMLPAARQRPAASKASSLPARAK